MPLNAKGVRLVLDETVLNVKMTSLYVLISGVILKVEVTLEARVWMI